MRNLVIIAIIALGVGSCKTDLPSPNHVGNSEKSAWFMEVTVDGKSVNLYANPSSFYSGKPYSPYGFMRVLKSSSSIFQVVMNDSQLNPLFQFDIQLKNTVSANYNIDTTEFKKGFGNKVTVVDVKGNVFYDAFGTFYKEYGVTASPLHPEIGVVIDKYEGQPKRDANGIYTSIGSVSGTILGTIAKKSGTTYSLVPIAGKFKLPIY